MRFPQNLDQERLFCLEDYAWELSSTEYLSVHYYSAFRERGTEWLMVSCITVPFMVAIASSFLSSFSAVLSA